MRFVARDISPLFPAKHAPLPLVTATKGNETEGKERTQKFYRKKEHVAVRFHAPPPPFFTPTANNPPFQHAAQARGSRSSPSVRLEPSLTVGPPQAGRRSRASFNEAERIPRVSRSVMAASHANGTSPTVSSFWGSTGAKTARSSSSSGTSLWSPRNGAAAGVKRLATAGGNTARGAGEWPAVRRVGAPAGVAATSVPAVGSGTAGRRVNAAELADGRPAVRRGGAPSRIIAPPVSAVGRGMAGQRGNASRVTGGWPAVRRVGAPAAVVAPSVPAVGGGSAGGCGAASVEGEPSGHSVAGGWPAVRRVGPPPPPVASKSVPAVGGGMAARRGVASVGGAAWGRAVTAKDEPVAGRSAAETQEKALRVSVRTLQVWYKNASRVKRVYVALRLTTLLESSPKQG